jgi:hypothetical protein
MSWERLAGLCATCRAETAPRANQATLPLRIDGKERPLCPKYLFVGKIQTCGAGNAWRACGSILLAVSGVWAGHDGTSDLRLLRPVPSRQEPTQAGEPRRPTARLSQGLGERSGTDGRGFHLSERRPTA